MSEEDDSSSSRKSVMRRIRRLAAPRDRSTLREMLADAASHGLLDSDALSMVEGVLDVADLQVRDIMVPHNQMISVREDDPAQRILSVAIDSGHSRFPVLDADGEHVVGILLAKDLLRFYTLGAYARFDLREWMRKALFVPESKRVNVLLKELRMIALLRQVADAGNCEGASWAQMRIHRVASDVVVGLGYSSKLNAEWDFLCMLRDEGRAAAEAFLAAHGEDLGQRSSFDLDALLEADEAVAWMDEAKTARALDDTGLGLGHAAQDLQQRRLAGTVAADEPDAVAGAHGEAGTLDDEGAADLDRESAHRQHGRPSWQHQAPVPPCVPRRLDGEGVAGDHRHLHDVPARPLEVERHPVSRRAGRGPSARVRSTA